MQTKYSVVEGPFDQALETFHDFQPAHTDTEAQGIDTTSTNRIQFGENFYPANEWRSKYSKLTSPQTALESLNARTLIEKKARISFMYTNAVSKELCSFCLIYSQENLSDWVACHIRNINLSNANQTMHIFSPVAACLIPQTNVAQDFTQLCGALMPEESRDRVTKNRIYIAMCEKPGFGGNPLTALTMIAENKYTPEWIFSEIIDANTGEIKHGKQVNAFKAKINQNYAQAVNTLATHWTYRYFSPAPNLQPVRINPAICLATVALAARFLALGSLTPPIALALSLIFVITLAKSYYTFQTNEENLKRTLSI